MSASAASYEVYRKVDVQTASQGKLIVMLFNGAIQRSEEAKRQLEKHNIEAVHRNLIRAQDILAELRGALNMNAGEVAKSLDRMYEYIQHRLIQANINKDPEPISECIGMMTTIRDTWQELFDSIAQDSHPAHGKSSPRSTALLNMQG
jgi:flagellar protein FliS